MLGLEAEPLALVFFFSPFVKEHERLPFLTLDQ